MGYIRDGSTVATSERISPAKNGAGLIVMAAANADGRQYGT
jgi:hypothetical protein